MNRSEFDQLRDLPAKKVKSDIEFKTDAKVSPNLIFEQVRVENDLGLEVLLNGTYKPHIPAVTYNFVIKGVGAICRVDVNGTIHGDAGRTHKHALRSDSDPRRNLPHAVARPDLEGKSAREIWEILCEQANILHIGKFVDP